MTTSTRPASTDRKASLRFERRHFLPSSVLNHAKVENGISAISHVSLLLLAVICLEAATPPRADRLEEVRRYFRFRGWCI